MRTLKLLQILVTSLFVTFNSLEAQEIPKPEMISGEAFKPSQGIPINFIGENEASYFLLSNSVAGMEIDVPTYTTYRVKRCVINTIDKKTLNVINKTPIAELTDKNFDDLSGAEIIAAKNLSKESALIIYSVKIKKIDAYNIYGWIYDLRTLKPVNQAVLLATFNDKSSDNLVGYQAFMNQDQENFGIASANYNKSELTTTVTAYVYDNNMKEVNKLQQKISGSKSGKGIRDLIITKNGSMLTAVVYEKESSKTKQDEIFVKIISADAEKNVKSVDLEIAEGFPSDIKIEEVSNNKIIAIGNYYDDNGKEYSGGSFSAVINQNMEITDLETQPYTLTDMLNLDVSKTDVKIQKRHYNIMRNLVSYQILTSSDGGHYGVSYSMSPGQSGVRGNSIVVSKVNADGKFAWVKVLPRIVESSYSLKPCLPISYIENNNLFVLINDSFKNIKVFSGEEPYVYDADKKTKTKKTKTGGPYDFAGDEAIELDARFMLKNVTYRLTMFKSETGESVVDFLKPSNLGEGDFLRLLEEGEIAYNTENGDKLLCASAISISAAITSRNIVKIVKK